MENQTEQNNISTQEKKENVGNYPDLDEKKEACEQQKQDSQPSQPQQEPEQQQPQNSNPQQQQNLPNPMAQGQPPIPLTQQVFQEQPKKNLLDRMADQIGQFADNAINFIENKQKVSCSFCCAEQTVDKQYALFFRCYNCQAVNGSNEPQNPQPKIIFQRIQCFSCKVPFVFQTGLTNQLCCPQCFTYNILALENQHKQNPGVINTQPPTGQGVQQSQEPQQQQQQNQSKNNEQQQNQQKQQDFSKEPEFPQQQQPYTPKEESKQDENQN